MIILLVGNDENFDIRTNFFTQRNPVKCTGCIRTGSKPCSTLVKAWEGGSFFDKNFFDAWMTGFVSGANWISKKSIQADETDFGMSLLKFCKANPSKKVITGVIYVYTELN